MRTLALLGLACVGLASCDSPYGKDFSKPDNQNYALSTGGHIKGATTSSSVSSAGGGALDAVSHSNGDRNTLGGQ
jgi:hypothetical protein